MDLNEKLLNQSGQSGQDSADKAGALREERNKPENEAQPPEDNNQPEAENDNQPADETDADAAADKDQASKNTSTPATKATSNLLRSAWTNIIPTFGLSIIWVNIHVFLGTIVGDKFFCKLGMEWMDNNIKGAQVEYAKKTGKMIGIVENSGLACLDLGCLLILIAFLAFFFMVVGIIGRPLDLIWETIKSVFVTIFGLYLK